MNLLGYVAFLVSVFVVASKPIPDDSVAEREHERKKAGFYFDMLDLDGDGFLTVDEAMKKIDSLAMMFVQVSSLIACLSRAFGLFLVPINAQYCCVVYRSGCCCC